MNDALIINDENNLNVSGFNDDSMISEEEDSRIKSNNNFLIKSNTNISVEKELNKPCLTQKENTIKGNFEVLNPNEMNAQDYRNYTEVMLEDLFSNSYVIPMNRPSKFSTSKMGYKFIYESNSKINSYKIDSKKFGLSKNSEVITYLLSLFIFSEFLNLEELEKDKRIKVIFLKQNKIQNRFIVDNENAFLNNLEIPTAKANDFEMFINGVNNFLTENDYLNLKTKMKKKILSVFAIIIVIVLLIIGIVVAISFSIKHLLKVKNDPLNNSDDKNGNKKSSDIITLVLEIILLLAIIFVLILKIFDAKNLKLLSIYYELRYLLINYNRVNEHIELWNNNLFENYKIRVSMPISLKYIMFNLNPYQNIEIKHLDLDWMKKKFYKTQNDIFKNEKEFKLFNTIKQKLFQNKERQSLSIN